MISPVERSRTQSVGELEERPQKPRLVFIGGGSGTSNTLELLSPNLANLEIDVIGTTFDDGGSSGVLKRVFAGTEAETVGFGDFRRMIFALAPDEVKKNELEYWEDRSIANGGSEWNGHPLGNLYLLIATQKEGSFEKAIKKVASKFKLQGRIHPVTIDSSRLCAWTKSGKYLEHEHVIDEFWSINDPIVKIGLTRQVRLHKDAKEALEKADIIVLGPGSHFTSLVPNLLVTGLRTAVARARGRGARLVYVSNLVAEMGYGEPYGYSVSGYLRDVLEHLRLKNVDLVLGHNGEFPAGLMKPYLKEHKYPVPLDREECSSLASSIIEADFLAVTPEGRFRHNKRLAQAILSLATSSNLRR